MAQAQEVDETGQPLNRQDPQYSNMRYQDPYGQPGQSSSAQPPTPSTIQPTTYYGGQGGDPNNRDYVRSQITSRLSQLGLQPGARGSGNADVEYWTDRALQTGGWTPDNAGYWNNRIAQEVSGHSPEGGMPTVGGGGGYQPQPVQPLNLNFQNPYSDAVYSAIQGALRDAQTPVTRESVQSQYAPVDAVMQRAADRTRTGAAERAAFQGTNIGGAGGPLDTEQRQIDEGLGQQEGQLMASLIGTELQARRKELTDALSLAHGEESLALQQQIAAIDAQLRNTQIGNQNQQFYAGLGQQNQQFYDQFGADQARQEYLMNQYFQNALAA